MILKSLKFKHFKCFESYEVNFEKINLLEGAIGIGKSTILEGLVFALYGYYGGILADLPNKRTSSKSCMVTAIIEDKGDTIEITREFPLKLTTEVNGKDQKLSTSEGNKYLEERFGTRLQFNQFRILDAYDKEVNFLSQGDITLKKILFAGTDELFNKVRNNLTAIKLEREKLNKDAVVIYKHYPSEKRLQALITKLVDISNSLVIINKEIDEDFLGETKSELSVTLNKIDTLSQQINNVATIKSSYDSKLTKAESRHTEIQRTVGEINKRIEEVNHQTATTKTSNICYVCKQPLSEHSSRDILKERMEAEAKLNKQLEDIRNEDIEICSNIPIFKEAIIKEREKKVEDFKKEKDILEINMTRLTIAMTNEEEILAQNKINRDALLVRKDKLNALKSKLEARLQQKQYIYTERDVIVVKKAIEELDKLSSIYLVETVHSLEPIINSVISKIGFAVTFDVDTKGKFNILLEREGVQYKYKDLSCGQRLILQIALKLALLMQESKSGLIVSDEGLSALENDNLSDIIGLFKELPFQLVFVLHRASIEDNEVNIIKLGGSYEKTT